MGLKLSPWGAGVLGCWALYLRAPGLGFRVYGLGRKGFEFRVRGSVHSAEGGGVGGLAMVSTGVRMRILKQVEEWE